MTLEISKQITENTASQRRVYNGCMDSSDQNFTPFEVLESEIPEDIAEERLAL